MAKWQYKFGFTLEEFNRFSNSAFNEASLESRLTSLEFKFEKIKVEDALRRAIPLCFGAVYKNPSSMREDAPKAFSCSSLISYLYTQAGVWMPSLSIDKYVFAKKIDESELKFGDLVFSNTGNGHIRTETVEWRPGTPVPEGVDHVGLYLGDRKVLHSAKKKGGVVIDSLEEFESLSKIIGYGRVANINEIRYVVSPPYSEREIPKKEHLFRGILDDKTLAS